MTGTETMTLNGVNHRGDTTTQAAKADLQTAYNKAAAMGPATKILADLGGRTLQPGIYHGDSSIFITGTLTLDGGGDKNAVFIFQAESTITTATNSKVVLINRAEARNVFWTIGSSATLGTYSSFKGTIMAVTSITVTTGVVIKGRTLAINGAVTLDTNKITNPNKLVLQAKIISDDSSERATLNEVGAVSVFSDGSNLLIEAALTDEASTTLAIKSYRIFANNAPLRLSLQRVPRLSQYSLLSPSNFDTCESIDVSAKLSTLGLTCGKPFNFVLSLKLVSATGQIFTAWAIGEIDSSGDLLSGICLHQLLTCP
jgi:hypothetical protein